MCVYYHLKIFVNCTDIYSIQLMLKCVLQYKKNTNKHVNVYIYIINFIIEGRSIAIYEKMNLDQEKNSFSTNYLVPNNGGLVTIVPQQ